MTTNRQSAPNRDTALLSKLIAAFGTWDELLAPADEVPPELLATTDQDFDDTWVPWRPIQVITPLAAARELESCLPAPLPSLYRQLVLTYRYLDVDLDRFSLLANPPTSGLHGLKEEMFRDEFLSLVLLRHGFIQFGRSGYDPVCFNTARRKSGGEMEVVGLDHEQILCYERIKVIETVAPTFRELVEGTIEAPERRTEPPRSSTWK